MPEGLRRGQFDRYRVAAEIAMAEGHPQDAIAALRARHDECPTCDVYGLAETYDRMGQADSALALYERFVETPTMDRIWQNWVAVSDKRLGELYEAKGDRAKARDYYGRFVDLWKNADPELQPAVRDVQQRIAPLAGER